MNITTAVAIISAEKPYLDPGLNAARTQILEQQLHETKTNYKRVHIVENGQAAVAFLVNTSIEDALTIARDFDQSKMIYVDSNRFTTSHSAEGGFRRLGELRAISASEALSAKLYTTDGEKYWGVTR
jgi:hypothetical protein